MVKEKPQLVKVILDSNMSMLQKPGDSAEGIFHGKIEKDGLTFLLLRPLDVPEDCPEEEYLRVLECSAIKKALEMGAGTKDVHKPVKHGKYVRFTLKALKPQSGGKSDYKDVEVEVEP